MSSACKQNALLGEFYVRLVQAAKEGRGPFVPFHLKILGFLVVCGMFS